MNTTALPSIRSYGQYSSDNYGAHTLLVDIGPVRVWFSYRTPVAFHVNGHARVVHKNDWGMTTGKHLNWIDDRDHKNRVDGETFERLWNEQVEPYLKATPQESPWAVGLAG